MKFLATTILALFFVMIPIRSWVQDFTGAIYRVEDTSEVTVSWDPNAGANGSQLRIVHFFYEVQEPVVEVAHADATTYTFVGLPKSSRHFSVELRSIQDINAGVNDREYSVWVTSTDPAYATVDGQPQGWLIYTKPGAPGGVIIGIIDKLKELGNKLVLVDKNHQKTV